MKRLAFACVLLASWANAVSPSASVRVQVADSVGLTFNHLAQNTLSVQTPWGTQQAVFSGSPYAPDPKNYWSQLLPLTLRLKVPATAKAGSYPIRASAQLYLCDQRAHLCSVKSAEASGEVTVGPTPARLELLLSVPVFRLSP